MATDIMDAIARFKSDLAALDITPKTVELTPEDGRKLLTVIRDAGPVWTATVPRAGNGQAVVRLFGIEFRWHAV